MNNALKHGKNTPHQPTQQNWLKRRWRLEAQPKISERLYRR
ncbi:hypothetical protein [Thiomonas sp. X19]|nr:hypothetical protein [Thiomonas sp. X19]